MYKLVQSEPKFCYRNGKRLKQIIMKENLHSRYGSSLPKGGHSATCTFIRYGSPKSRDIKTINKENHSRTTALKRSVISYWRKTLKHVFFSDPTLPPVYAVIQNI